MSIANFTRRQLLCNAGTGLGLSLPAFLTARSSSATTRSATTRAKSCIVLYCWGGMSHHEVFDPRPDAPVEVRGEFSPISTSVPGVIVGEHIPRLSQLIDRMAIIRSVHHDQSAHGRGMYWNLTGHAPPPIPGGNIAPTRDHWPSLAAMVSKFREAPKGVPRSVRLPYPLVDNGTLQAGEYGGWLGVPYDPIVIKTPTGTPWGGVSRSLGAEVLDLKNNVTESRATSRRQLVASLERPISTDSEFGEFEHFRELAADMLLSSAVRTAYNLELEDSKIRDSYGMHIGGQSMLLARRLVEVGIPIVQVCCSAGDLNGGAGDMWDTHSDNFNRLKKRLLPVFDQATSALITDLEQRGMLDETLVVVLTDFGRTPRINGGAGRDHYPSVYSVAMAGGGIRGGQVYGSSDTLGAFPRTAPCSPADVHATIFKALGISPRATIHDRLGRPFPVSDGDPLPLT